MDSHLEDLIFNSKENDEGLTNDVYFTENNTVIKVYNKYPLTAFIQTLADLIALKPGFINRKERMDNEVNVKKEVKNAGLCAPEVLERSGNVIEFEKASGDSGYRYLEKCSSQEAHSIGKEIGKFIPTLHNRGVALKDFRISNTVIGDEIFLIDHEYSSLSANKMLKWIDYVTLFSSIRQTKNYRDFKIGFLSETSVPLTAQLASVISSSAHAVFLERDFSRVSKIISSIKVDLTS